MKWCIWPSKSLSQSTPDGVEYLANLSVTISSTPPNFEVCPRALAAIPSTASSKLETA